MNTRQVKRAIQATLQYEEDCYMSFLQLSEEVLPRFRMRLDMEVKVGNNSWAEVHNIITDRPNTLYRNLKSIKAVKCLSLTVVK